MLLVAILANTKRCKKKRKITETLANRYSSESTRQELSNEYQDDRVSMVFQRILHSCALDESSLSIGRVNPDMCNLDFRLNWTDWKDLVPSYTYNSYMQNPDFA